jgi:hypothetical protein
MATEFIVSPLTEALYGSDFEIDGKRVPIRKNVEVPDEDDSKKNVIYRLVDRLMLENDMKRGCHVFEPETIDELYDTIKSNVLACKMFTSRHIGRCYISNKNYGENCKEMRGHVFPGAESALGARWFFSALPYHESSEWLLPFADLCFNFGEYMVPVRDFPNIYKHSDGKNYIVVNVKRTNGLIQRGFIKVDKKSMVVYRAIEDRSFIHPAYVSPDMEIQPIVSTHFMHDGSDLSFNSMVADYPIADCTKDIPIKELIKINPDLADAFKIGDDQFARFHDAFEVSVMNAVEWM